MSQVWWLWALFALVVGGVLGYLVASRKARVLETELDEAQEQRLAALQEAAADRSAREQLEQRVDHSRPARCRTRT